MSIMFAPFATCWRAIATAPSKSPARISFENFGEPVIFVRSPMTAKPKSRVIFNGSSPASWRSWVSFVRSASPEVSGEAPETAREARQLFDEGSHFIRAERAIQSHHQWIRVRDGSEKCFQRLTTEGASGTVRDRPRNDQRNGVFLECFGNGEQRGLGIERVENRL